jgi:hypothetical protein
MTTPRLGAPELTSGQATPETTVNEQIRYIESGAGHFIFKDRDLATPPGSPADGDCYLVAASPTGAWSGQAGKITFYVNTAWAFITAIEGFTAWINDENVFVGYDGASWSTLSSPSGTYQPLDADLTAIAALTGTNNIYYRSAANTWTSVTIGSNLTFSGGTLAASLTGAAITAKEEGTNLTTTLTSLNWVGAGVTASNSSGDVTITLNEATAAQYQGNTANKLLLTDKVWTAADYTALTDAATVAVDMSTGINFSVTLGGNRTLGNPSNTKNGQTGLIVINQDGTGSRTLAYSSNWKFAGGTAPTLTTTASARDLLFYQVISSTVIYGTLVKDVK